MNLDIVEGHGFKVCHAHLLLLFGVKAVLDNWMVTSINDCLNSFAEIGGTQNHLPYITRELQSEGGKMNLLPSHLSIGVLQEIGRRCGSKVPLNFLSIIYDFNDHS